MQAYKNDTTKIISLAKAAIELPKDAPNKEETVAELRKARSPHKENSVLLFFWGQICPISNRPRRQFPRSQSR